VRRELESLRDTLLEAGDSHSAGLVTGALAGSDECLRKFLASDELWGGAGSIADQAGSSPSRDDSKRAIEAALVSLGETQIAAGVVNPRTATWVDVFRSWQRDGI